MIIKDLFDWFGEQINNYNLFITDTDEGNDISTIRRQRYATRLYVILLIVIFYILSFIAFVSPQTRFITIFNITPSVFNQLRNEHGETLSCPCSTTTITYRNFVFNSISFHPVCSSIFISEEWIDTLYFSNASAFLVMDFRTTAYSQFKLLAALCKFCQETIFQIEIDLDNNTLITAKLLSENEVRSQVIGNIELIQSSKPIQVLLSLYFLQIISQSNSFISSLNINAAINIYIDKQDYIIGGGFTTYRNKKSSEFASTILTCESTNSVIPVGFYQISYEDSSDYHLWWPEYLPYFEPEPSAVVDGFFGGCTVFDSLLMSTLDCLYKIECLERLRYYFPKLKSMNSSWMNILLISKQQNRSLYNHLNNLLIEQWTTNINYTTYFQTCAPIICTYSKTDRMNLTYTITLLLSLYGGLIFILRLLTHLLIDILFKFKLHQINTQLNNEQNLSIIRRIIQWIIQLNLFQSIRQQTPTNIKEQRLSTRIYLILLSSSYLIIILLTTLNTQTITIIESNPSLIEYKSYEKLYSNSLQCPCSNITISYSIFNSFHPILHEICSSNFITDSWIMMMRLLQGDSLMTGFYFDFNWRGINAQQMQLLSMSCQRANKTIEDAIHRFNQRSFTTSKVLTQSNFNAVMNTTVDQFIRSLIIDFNLLFNTSHLFTQVDQPFTKPNQNNLILKSTTQMTIKMNRLIMNTEIFSECICSTNPDCRLPFSFIDLQVKKSNRTSNSTYNLRSGMEQGCFVIDSLLHSTLECFYSNDCLSILYHYMNRTFYTYNTGVTWFTVPPLIYESSTISRFPPTTSMNIIIKQMMVEQWNSFYSFDHYYTACSPNYCTYSQTTRASAIGIILTLISTIGGLTVALRLITPQIIKLTSNLFQPKINKQINRIRPRLCVRIKILLTNIVERIYRELIDLNMFSQENFGRNINRIRMKQLGQLSTRLYIILLISGLSILLLYSIIQPRILTKTFNKPTLNSYNHLILDHNNSLQCPCSMISSMYKQYVTIEPRFHPICSSRFATNKWRLKITSNLAADVSIYHHRDYRRFLSAHLQFLIGICELSIQSVNDSIDQFLSSLFITPQLQSLKDFQKHIDSLVIQRQSIAPIAVANLINLLRNINHGNAILSTYETNFKYYISKWYNSTFFFGHPVLSSLVLTEPVIYDNECSCAFTSNCTTQAVFINQDLSKNISIKGLKMGCTPSESFLASTLECFYDSSCLQIIQEQVNYIKTNYSPIMYVANSSRFAPNMTLVNLVNELFIENWITTIDYSAYFYNCSPEFCSYTYRQQVNSLYTTTLLIALYGGLSVVLQWICPNIIYFFVNTFWYRKKRFNTVGSIRTIEIDIITTDHAKPISTPSTAEPSFCLGLLRFLLVGFLFLLLLTMAFIGPFLYLRQQNKEYTTNITNVLVNSNSTIITSSTTSTNAMLKISISTSTVPPCQTTFSSILSYSTGSGVWPKSVVVGDFNIDGYRDIAVANFYGDNVGIFLGKGDGNFSEQVIYSTGIGSGPNMLILADINNDNQLDLAVNNNNNYSVGLFIGSRDGTFQEQRTLSTASNITMYFFTIADFNHDDQLDFVVMDTFQIGILFGNGNATFQSQLTSSIQSGCTPVSAATADFNHDNQLDLTIVCFRESIVIILFGNGNGNFDRQITLSTGQFSRPTSISIGDFNSDNQWDLAVVNSLTYNIGIMLGNDNETFKEQTIYSTGDSSRPNAMVIGDFNHDNQLDLAVVNRNTHNVGIMYGIGNGTFLEQITFSTGNRSAPFAITSGDLNNDDKLDIVIADMSSATIGVLLNQCENS